MRATILSLALALSCTNQIKQLEDGFTRFSQEKHSPGLIAPLDEQSYDKAKQIVDSICPCSAQTLQQLIYSLDRNTSPEQKQNGSVGIYLGAVLDAVEDKSVVIPNIPKGITLFGAYSEGDNYKVLKNFGDMTFFCAKGSDHTIMYNGGECAFWTPRGTSYLIEQQGPTGGFHKDMENGDNYRVDGEMKNICLRWTKETEHCEMVVPPYKQNY